jgi:hypothetical protein
LHGDSSHASVPSFAPLLGRDERHGLCVGIITVGSVLETASQR